MIYTGKAEGAGIRLYNQSWWIVENMEITSGAAPELGIGRQGIAAIVRGADQHVENIIIRNCYIHDIWGQLGEIRNLRDIIVVLLLYRCRMKKMMVAMITV